MKTIFSKHKESDKSAGGETAPAGLAVPENNARHSESPEPGFPESPAESRTLQVEYDTYWNQHTTIRVTDSISAQELYTIEARHRKPQMRILSCASNTELATVAFHALTTRIDMTLNGQPLVLESGGWNTRYSYNSLASSGEPMTWRPRKKLDDLNMVLLNGQGLAIARFKPDYKGSKRGGSLELLAECWKTDHIWEEVVVVALVVIHYKESQRIVSATVTLPAAAT